MSSNNKIDLDIYELLVKTLTQSDNLEAMGSDLTQILVGATGLKGSAILILNPETESFEILATEGLSIAYRNKGPILVDQSINLEANQRPVTISNTQESDQLQYPEKAEAEGIKAIVSIPITIRGKIIGALRVYHSEIWEVSRDDMTLLTAFAGSIGMALMYFRLSTALQAIKEDVDDIHPIWL